MPTSMKSSLAECSTQPSVTLTCCLMVWKLRRLILSKYVQSTRTAFPTGLKFRLQRKQTHWNLPSKALKANLPLLHREDSVSTACSTLPNQVTTGIRNTVPTPFLWIWLSTSRLLTNWINSTTCHAPMPETVRY